MHARLVGFRPTPAVEQSVGLYSYFVGLADAAAPELATTNVQTKSRRIYEEPRGGGHLSGSPIGRMGPFAPLSRPIPSAPWALTEETL